MNLEQRIMRLINAGDRDLDLFRRALTPRDLPHNERSWAKDRAYFLYIAFVRMARSARVPAAPRARAVVYDPSARDADVRASRLRFVQEHFNRDADFVLADLVKGEGGPRQMTARERRLSRHWRWRARVCAVAALFDRSHRYRWWGDVFSTIHTVSQAVDQIDTAFVFLVFDRRSYAVATILTRHTAVKTYAVFQSMPLYGNQRFMHAPVAAVATSKVNVRELEYFGKVGWSKAREVLYRSGEQLAERDQLTPSPPVYDIGFFATGDWARIDGKYWAVDVEQARAGAYRGNVYEQHAERVLDWLVDYAHARRRTLRIYMHPYERRLHNEYGIEPPYRDLADGELVTIDDRPGHSRGSHFEPNVAVALRSGTIWERLDLGLARSFMYVYDDPRLGNVLPEALGEYQSNLFASRDELYEKLDECLGGEPSREVESSPAPGA